MRKATHTVICNNCGVQLDESASLPSEQRAPCPNCGSTARRFAKPLQGQLLPRGQLVSKARHEGSRKVFLESLTGASFYRDLKKWVRRKRIIDRDNHWYSEIITDPETCEVIHRCEEPLSQHRGHGSAKEKPS